MHDPLFEYEWDTGFWAIEKMLQQRPYTVFAGHYHAYIKRQRFGRNYYVLASTGSSQTPTRLPADPTPFDHFMWTTMTKDGPVVANISLDGIFDDVCESHSMNSEERKFWREWIEGRAEQFDIKKAVLNSLQICIYKKSNR